MGKSLTEEHKEKLRQAKLKNPVRYWLGKKNPGLKDTGAVKTMFKKGNIPWFVDKENPGKKGEDHHAWKGDEVGYDALHDWVRRSKGRAKRCEECQSVKNVQWANKSYEYERDLSDWIELCVKCHRIRDYKNGWGLATNKYPELRRNHV